MARDSIQLPFGDDQHELRGKHVFRTAREIEDVITITEIGILTNRGAIPYARIGSAYALVLKKAGVTTDEEAVFEWLFEGGDGLDQNVFKAMEKIAEVLVPAAARKIVSSKGGEAAADVPLSKDQASSKRRSS